MKNVTAESRALFAENVTDADISRRSRNEGTDMEQSNRKMPPAQYRLEFNPDRCRWCRACELICSFHHEGEFRPAASRIRMLLDPFKAEMKASVCRQCRRPRCLLACPEDAIVVDERTGARIILSDRCTGCGTCADACPFDKEGTILRLDETAGVYVKCDLCGGAPKCAEICPTDALTCAEIEGR